MTFNFDTSAIQSHLELLQGVIQRMAENSPLLQIVEHHGVICRVVLGR